jgi:hypothetical protein
MASNVRIIDEWRLGKDLEGSGCDVTEFAWRNRENP